MLHGALPELLNHLCCLGNTTLVLRQQGISLAKSTSFGLCVATRDSDWRILRDHLSGLETDTATLQNIYLLAGPGDRRPMIGLGEPGRPLHLTIRLDAHDWESRAIRNLIDYFKGVSLDCTESRRLGVGAWLDEWERPVAAACDDSLVRDTCQVIRTCEELEVEVGTRSHRNTARFHPTFIDSSGTVMRVADRSQRHVVHADVADPGFRIFLAEPSRMRIAVDSGI